MKTNLSSALSRQGMVVFSKLSCSVLFLLSLMKTRNISKPGFCSMGENQPHQKRETASAYAPTSNSCYFIRMFHNFHQSRSFLLVPACHGSVPIYVAVAACFSGSRSASRRVDAFWRLEELKDKALMYKMILEGTLFCFVLLSN